jgi:hypothetical protein
VLPAQSLGPLNGGMARPGQEPLTCLVDIT